MGRKYKTELNEFSGVGSWYRSLLLSTDEASRAELRLILDSCEKGSALANLAECVASCIPFKRMFDMEFVYPIADNTAPSVTQATTEIDRFLV